MWIGLKHVQNRIQLVNKKMPPVTYFCPYALLPGTQQHKVKDEHISMSDLGSFIFCNHSGRGEMIFPEEPVPLFPRPLNMLMVHLLVVFVAQSWPLASLLNPVGLVSPVSHIYAG